MENNFINIILKDNTNKFNLNNNEILELFKISLGKNVYNFNYPYISKENIKDDNLIKLYDEKNSSEQNLEINYYKKSIKKNFGKMIYKAKENNKEIKLFNKIFILNNYRKTKIIINNKKQHIFKEKINNNNNKNVKVKIKFFDNILNLNSIFKDCESLYSFENFKFSPIKNINEMFSGCSNLEELPYISDINISNVNNIKRLFYNCKSLKYLPDISNWNIDNIIDISELFYNCSSLKVLPDISKWDITNIKYINKMFFGCSKLESFPDILCYDIN